MTWRKSTLSHTNGCVEVAFGWYGPATETNPEPCVVAVRDSKDFPRSVLLFTAREWQAFLDGARAGEFDLPRHEEVAR